MKSMENEQPPVTLPLDDIQGLIIRGYNMNKVRHFILHIDKADAAKHLIGNFVGGVPTSSLQITTAAPWDKKPSYCLNIGFTFEGLKALELPEFSFQSFDSFRQGAAAQAKEIGDLGESAPEHWKGGLGTPNVHVLLSLYAQDDDVLESQSTTLRFLFAQGEAVNELSHFDGNTFPDSKIHFGYKDGISQPTIEGGPQMLSDRQAIIPAYQFIVMNDDRRFYEVPTPHQLGLYGSFVAFRVLEQDVAGFEKFLQDYADKIEPEKLAAKLCGRWRNGVPLALSPDAQTPISDNQLNDFDYSDDSKGFRCPIGSHMRRTNPRAAKVQGITSNHRLMRRGMPYGPPYNPNSPEDGIERGLLGMFICVSLENQFEFVMKNWVNEGDFAGLPSNNKDPIVGDNSSQSGEFNIPAELPQNSLKIQGFQRFIKTRGSAYCFLPSITALKYIAANRNNRL